MYENSLAYYDVNLDEICELREEIRSKIRGTLEINVVLDYDKNT